MSKFNFTFLSLAGLLLSLANVSGGQNPGSAVTGLDVYDGFETPRLSKLWSTDRFEPGAVTMQTNLVRAGHSGAQIVLRSHDIFEAGLNGSKDTERDELLEAKKLTSKENINYEQSFSLFFPTNFPIVPTRLIIAQWKQYCGGNDNCSDDSPVLAVRYISGALKITQNIGKHETVLYQEQAEFRDRWLDFKFQTRFTTNQNGRIKAWLDGRLVVDYTGVTAYSENAATGYPSPSRFYFKMGLYRDLMAEPMTIYLDEYRKRELPDDGF